MQKWGWKHVLNFKDVVKFEPPLPIKQTIIKDTGLWGNRLHGYRLTSEQARSILSKAEQTCSFV